MPAGPVFFLGFVLVNWQGSALVPVALGDVSEVF